MVGRWTCDIHVQLPLIPLSCTDFYLARTQPHIQLNLLLLAGW